MIDDDLLTPTQRRVYTAWSQSTPDRPDADVASELQMKPRAFGRTLARALARMGQTRYRAALRRGRRVRIRPLSLWGLGGV